MKNGSIFGAGLAAMFLAFPCAAELRNEPAEFRGIPWGAAYEQFQGQLKLLRRDGEIAVYLRPSDSLSMGSFDAVKIAYRFYKDQFSAAIVQTYGRPNAKAIRQSMLEKHGTPERPYRHVDQSLWQGQDVNVLLTCEITTYCVAEYVSTRISALEAADGGEPPGRPGAKDND